MKNPIQFRFLLAIAIAFLISGMAVAQDQDAGDPPSRVMRLQYLNGQVSMQPGGVDDWVPANLNRPLTTADRVWVDQGGRAELTMGSAALRMSSETSVTITNLDDQTAQIELDQGTLELSVRFLNQGEIVEVDTPNFAYTVERPGQYRFDVIPDQDQSVITVKRGEGEATGQGNSVRVRGGQSFRFTQGQSLAYQDAGRPGRDGFDDWCAVRERRETDSPSARYVAAGTIGYEDLDDNGSWATAPEYGQVWYPRVHEGWAPYREGHWAWVEPWGWTWVDDAPWGFAPFHYGRWAQIRGRWGWVPGPVGVRPVYAPALVAWVGGPSFGVSVGIGGGVGWFPLGWHDPFIPSYHVSPHYAREVNISNSRVVNTTIINNYYTTNNVNVRNTTINNIHYENSRVNGAVTGVSSANFASGKPIRGNTVVIPPNAIGRANVMAGAQVVPTREAVLGGRPPAAAPQRLVAPRQVVSRAAPPPRPVSFDQQRPLLEKSGGMPLRPQERAQIRASNPAPAPTGGRGPVAAPGGKPGAAMGGQPGNQPGGRPPAGNAPKGNDSFTRPPAGQPAGGAPKPPTANEPPARFNQPAANQPSANQPKGNDSFTRPGQPAGGVPKPPTANQPPARVNQPAPNQPSANQPKGNDSFTRPGQPAAEASKPPTANQPPARFNQPPAANTNQPPAKVNQPPAGFNRGGENRGAEPARNVPRPPAEATPAQPTRNAPAAQPQRSFSPEERSAPQRPVATPPASRPAPEVRAAPTPRPAPEVRAAPSARPAPAPARVESQPPQRKAAPPEKENKGKDKEKEKDR